MKYIIYGVLFLVAFLVKIRIQSFSISILILFYFQLNKCEGFKRVQPFVDFKKAFGLYDQIHSLDDHYYYDEKHIRLIQRADQTVCSVAAFMIENKQRILNGDTPTIDRIIIATYYIQQFNLAIQEMKATKSGGGFEYPFPLEESKFEFKHNTDVLSLKFLNNNVLKRIQGFKNYKLELRAYYNELENALENIYSHMET